MQRKKPWIRFRHRVFRAVARPFLAVIAKWRYGAAADRFREQGNRAYLILLNHQTPFDQFFITLSFRRPVYFLATEDIFSKGLFSVLLRWLAAPIPILKQTTDVSAVRTCVRVAREGGTIAIAPEGNRTYSGRTEYMSPGIVVLARTLKLPVALYRIEGGYGVQPRWSDVIRRGHIHAYVSRVIEPEDYAKLSNDGFFELIRSGLFVDEGRPGERCESSRRAEYLERAVYYCPFCGLSVFRSNRNLVRCETCGREIEYGADRRLRGVDHSFPFSGMTEWYDAQCAFVRQMDPALYAVTPAFTDTADLYEVIVRKSKHLLRRGSRLNLYGDRLVVDEGRDGELVFPFRDVTAATALGRNKLNLYFGGKAWQFRGGKRFNALKYVNFCYHCKNVCEGNANGEFLGL